MSATFDATGTLASGGQFAATPSYIEVTYPGTEKPPVSIDMHDIQGVRRRGTEVTLIRSGRETALRTTSLAEAARLEGVVWHQIEKRIAEEFQIQIQRLHAQGYILDAVTTNVAHMTRSRRPNPIITAALLLIGVVLAVLVGLNVIPLEFLDDRQGVDRIVIGGMIALGSLLPLIVYMLFLWTMPKTSALLVQEAAGDVVVRIR